MRPSLFVILTGLIISSAALAQSKPQATATCGLREPQRPRAHGLGTVTALQDPARSRAGISAREVQAGGAIDSRYQSDLRVTVRQDNGLVDNFDVPPGITAHVGDRVHLQGSYRSTAAACSYIPHMAIPNDALLF